jgi:hypothetical protein
MKTYRYFKGACLILMAAELMSIHPLAAQEMPPEIIAAQIRSQGFACERPLSAERDKKLSKPDQAVWTLKCQNIVYRVRLDPGMGARVQRLK